MKKNLIKVLVLLILGVGTTMYVATTNSPDHYEMHVVTYGETMESIVKNANRNSDVNYDVRDAIATAVSESNKIDGGATSRSIKPGEKVAVPIYRR